MSVTPSSTGFNGGGRDMLGPDPKIESFLSKVVGCPFSFQAAMPITSLDTSQTRQLGRQEARTADYVQGIAETMRIGGYVPPILVTKRAKTKDLFDVLDGINRVAGASLIHRETIGAYVVEPRDPAEAALIAQCANVILNGQGLSEIERRHHFISLLRQYSPDLSDERILQRPIGRRLSHLFSVATGTGKLWVDVERFKSRAARLGLKLPPPHEGHRSGERGDQWIAAVSRLTDEELREFWPVLQTSPANAIKKAAKELSTNTSSKARLERAQLLLPALNPTIRMMSQSKADVERRMAQQIQSHGKAIIKLAPELGHLANKYEDVRNTLQDLHRCLAGVGGDEQEAAAIAN